MKQEILNGKKFTYKIFLVKIIQYLITAEKGKLRNLKQQTNFN